MVHGATQYADAVHSLLQRIVETQMEHMQRAGAVVADAIANDGLVYAFGTGHSHVVAEEVALRAATLVPIDAILEPSLTGHVKMGQSFVMERVEGMAEVILDYYDVEPRDAMVIISNSGRNAVPIEMALGAQARGLPVVAITSMEMSQGQPSRHSSGKRLYDFADVVIDNCCPMGDALLHLQGAPAPVGAASGVASMFIMHSVLVEATQILIDRGIEPPIAMHGNVDGTDEYNAVLLQRYKHRLKVW
jgi:uncharacterized phosphosugar-binding protein